MPQDRARLVIRAAKEIHGGLARGRTFGRRRSFAGRSPPVCPAKPGRRRTLFPLYQQLRMVNPQSLSSQGF